MAYEFRTVIQGPVNEVLDLAKALESFGHLTKIYGYDEQVVLATTAPMEQAMEIGRYISA